MLAQLGRSHEQGNLAHIEILASAEAIPANYLVQILNELRGAGLIISKRGKQGGYALAKEPKQIPLMAIVEALEGELLEHNFENTGHSGQRVTDVWKAVGAALEEKLREYTLEDLVVRDAEVGMYYI